MGRSDDFEVVSVILDDRGEADTGKDLVESVADVFEFVVEFLAVVLEPVLEAFQEVGGEVGAVAAGMASRRCAMRRLYRAAEHVRPRLQSQTDGQVMA
jgi:hypothetical protein